jgi:hypothetical protein
MIIHARDGALPDGERELFKRIISFPSLATSPGGARIG